MKPTVAFVMSSLLLSGCATTQMVSSHKKSNSPYAPINEESTVRGTVRYEIGSNAAMEKRREEAYKRMHEHCGGPYRIEAEGARAEQTEAFLIGGAMFSEATKAWYIDFQCVPDVAKTK